jgi:hypothetical protein
MKLAIAILLLALAGCRVDHPARETRAERIDRLRAASRLSAARADSVVYGIGKYPETPDSSPTERTNP